MSRLNGDWIQTYTGRAFWPLDPHADDVCIEDIAHALAQLCRFTGHTTTFYSVAEHCIRVSEIVPEEAALWGLLHDASEAYLMDLPRPLKRAPDFGDLYKRYEHKLMAVICHKFGLPQEEPAIVKAADRILLRTEKRDLMNRSAQQWEQQWDPGEPLPKRIWPVPPVEAKAWYLQRFKELSGA